MKRLSTSVLLVAAALVGSVLPGSIQTAHAQSDSAAARGLFAEARTLMEKERYEEACPKFEESLRLDHGMGTQFNLAFCWEKLGRSASAWALFLDVAAAARAGNQPQREAAARERAEALEPKLTRLRIALTDPVPDTKVMRDDKEVGRAAWGTAMPVDPGDHVIVVTAPGKQQWTQDVKVPAASRTFSVTVPTLEDAVAPVAAESAPEPKAETQTVDTGTQQRSSGLSGQQVTGLVLGGVSVAALATGTVFAIQSNSDNNEALALCRTQTASGDRCDGPDEHERHRKLVADAKRELVLAYVGFGVGAAAAVTGIILVVTGGNDSGQGTFNVSPVFSADFRGAVLNGQF